jgi:hypothetical protein
MPSAFLVKNGDLKWIAFGIESDLWDKYLNIVASAFKRPAAPMTAIKFRKICDKSNP